MFDHVVVWFSQQFVNLVSSLPVILVEKVSQEIVLPYSVFVVSLIKSPLLTSLRCVYENAHGLKVHIAWANVQIISKQLINLHLTLYFTYWIFLLRAGLVFIITMKWVKSFFRFPGFFLCWLSLKWFHFEILHLSLLSLLLFLDFKIVYEFILRFKLSIFYFFLTLLGFLLLVFDNFIKHLSLPHSSFFVYVEWQWDSIWSRWDMRQ